MNLNYAISFLLFKIYLQLYLLHYIFMTLFLVLLLVKHLEVSKLQSYKLTQVKLLNPTPDFTLFSGVRDT